LPRPLPPWPRRLVLEVFRCRLAQVRPKGLCTCAPSVLSLHLAARRRRLSFHCRDVGRIATNSRQNHATCLHGVPFPFDALRQSYRHSDLAIGRSCERCGLATSLALHHGSHAMIPRDFLCVCPINVLPRDRARCRHPASLASRTRSCGTSRVRRLPARPLRASPCYLPGLFHPSGTLGVSPFRGLTSS